MLDTTLPKGAFIHLCHGCNNEFCSNPNHLYWGTAKDNHLDQVEAGTFRSIHERLIEKYGDDVVERKEWLEKRNFSKIKISEEVLIEIKKVIEQYAPYKFGWIKKCSQELGFSHSHIRRLTNKLGIETPKRVNQK